MSTRTRRVLQHVALAATGFILSYLFVAFFVIPDEVVAVDVTIPSVVGLAQADAERRLASLGLKFRVGESRFSGDAPKSTVLSQTPAAGMLAAPGSTVSLDISSGQQRATIPDLRGLTRDDAERSLQKAGLQLGQVEEQPGDAARGQVIDSKPGADVVVPLGTRIDLVVSGGPAELTMPDMIGRDLQTARGLLEQVGLTMNPVTFDSISTLPPGTVITQIPSAGSPVAAGTAVTLQVAGKP